MSNVIRPNLILKGVMCEACKIRPAVQECKCGARICGGCYIRKDSETMAVEYCFVERDGAARDQ